jgi:hypothetical protein
MRELRGRLAAEDLSAAHRFSALMELVGHELRQGEEEEAVAHVEEAGRILEGFRQAGASGEAIEAVFARYHATRGLAYLRLAEAINCVGHRTPESCLMPITEGGVHPVKEPGVAATASYLEALRLDPDELRWRWLLNLSAMTVGRYPDGIPAEHRIPAESFASGVDLGRFRDVAVERGVAVFDLAGGVAIEDFDGDGLLDIVTSTNAPDDSLRLFVGDGAGGFADRTAGSGLDLQLGGLNLIAADFDDDGDPDILVLRGAWHFDDGRVRNSLLRNDGGGSFSDVTRAAGLADPAWPTQAAAWLDFDLDGDLDLFVGNERLGPPEARVPLPSQLFRNEGDGTFVDVAQEAGVTNGRMTKGVTAGDFDNDGDPDLYVSTIGPNRLFRNEGDGTFVDVAPELGVTEPVGRSFAPWFFDVDNDGWLDLWVSGFDATLADIAAERLGLPHGATPPRLYRNEGGRFVDRAAEMGLDRPFLPMGANFGDVDGDGWLDLYLGTGDPDFQTLMPNVLLWNDRGRRFADATTAAGLGHLQKGHGVGFADLDGDGDQDLYHQLGGFVPGDRSPNALFLNPGHGRRFLTLRLVGDASNSAGFGTRVRLVLASPGASPGAAPGAAPGASPGAAPGGRREIHRAPGSVSSFGGSPTGRVELGLGDATAVERLEVTWPVSRTRQVFTDVPLDAFVEVREGDDVLRVVPR